MTQNTDFDPEQLLAEAAARAGHDDFGPGAFRDPLDQVCRSLDTEAPLSPEGRAALRERVIGSLCGRLAMQDWFRRYPEIADEDIGQPVVIAGLPRTGTTMLYRMLSAASGLTPPLFYEASYLSPAPDWDFDAATDPRITQARERVAGMNAAMPELASIYPFEAEAPEESIFLYYDSFVSTHQQSTAFVPGYDAWFAQADKTPAYEYLKRAVQFLQWQRKRSGRYTPGTRWLLKTPDHLHGLEELLSVFPGAQIIQTHRDPVETIPSICSFIRVLHSTTVARDDAAEIGDAWCTMFARSMTRALAVRARHPDSFLDIWYSDTVADPLKVAQQVFAFIGLPFTDAEWAEMERWREANKREQRPAHRYTLADFGLTRERIEADFRDYRERFIIREGAPA